MMAIFAWENATGSWEWEEMYSVLTSRNFTLRRKRGCVQPFLHGHIDLAPAIGVVALFMLQNGVGLWLV